MLLTNVLKKNNGQAQSILIAKANLSSRLKGLEKLLASLTACAIISVVTSNIGYCKDFDKNPILHSEEDITDELLSHISDNSLESLTIDYEFTRCMVEEGDQQENKFNYDTERFIKNPFWRVQKSNPIERLDFEIKLTPKVKSLACAFKDFRHLTNVNIKDTSHVTTMEGMFYGAMSFNHPIGNWNTSKVTSMKMMFTGAGSFNQPIGNWDTSKVTDFKGMFLGADSFNQPIGKWNTSSAKVMSAMFLETRSFNQPIGDWDTSNVTNMRYMFFNAKAFNQPIGNWNISKVTDMSHMFEFAGSFNQSLKKWDTSHVKDLTNMFNGASAYRDGY